MTGDKTPKLPEPEDLQVLRSRITEPVETNIVYEAIHSVGLYLDDSSIGKNVSGLKIFGGVGKVTVARPESFSRLTGYWVHLRITESLESSQTFNVSLLADDSALLKDMEDVVFRAVKPEQIQMAIAICGTKEDEKIYDMDWSEWSQSPSEASDDKEPVNLLAAADTSDLLRSKGLVQAMGAISAAQSSLRTPILAVARIQWSNLLAQLPRVPFLSKFSVAETSAREAIACSMEDVRSLVVDSLADTLGTDDLDVNTPLMQLGLQSTAGVEFCNSLQARCPQFLSYC